MIYRYQNQGRNDLWNDLKIREFIFSVRLKNCKLADNFCECSRLCLWLQLLGTNDMLIRSDIGYLYAIGRCTHTNTHTHEWDSREFTPIRTHKLPNWLVSMPRHSSNASPSFFRGHRNVYSSNSACRISNVRNHIGKQENTAAHVGVFVCADSGDCVWTERVSRTLNFVIVCRFWNDWIWNGFSNTQYFLSVVMFGWIMHSILW